MTGLQSLPLELLNRILFFVDQITLADVCVNVCSLWKSTLQDLGNPFYSSFILYNSSLSFNLNRGVIYYSSL